MTYFDRIPSVMVRAKSGVGKRIIKGQDVLSEDGKSFSRIVNRKDADGHDTSVIQVFEKQ